MRKFEFLLDPEVPPPTGFGGSKPSRTLIPASSLIVADRRASECPESIVDLPHDKAEYVCSRLADAAAAIEEVLKFMPDGADRIPETAFFAGDVLCTSASQDASQLRACRPFWTRIATGYSLRQRASC